MGKPFSKENTKQLFGDLLIHDPTFATEKFKREMRNIEKAQDEHQESTQKSNTTSQAKFSVIEQIMSKGEANQSVLK